MTDPRYLERPWKGIDWLTLKEAGVAISPAGLVTIPYRDRDGNLLRERFFAPSGGTWWGPGDGLTLLGLERLASGEEARRRGLIITEGESDCFAVREAYAGVADDHPLTGYDIVGVPGASCWRSEWRADLAQYVVIYAIGDGDEPGRKLMDRILADIGWARPVLLEPGDDARSLLQRDGPRTLDPYLDQADAIARLRAAFLAANTVAEFEQLLDGPYHGYRCAA